MADLALATGPVTWGVDFADAPTNPPWPLVLDDIAASGVGALELGPVGYLPEDPPTLRAARDASATTVIVCPTAPDRALLSAEAFWDLGVPEVAADEVTRGLTAEHLTRAEAHRRY